MPSRKFDKYAITVSPPSGTDQVLDLFLQKFMPKQSTKYIYVFEYGKDGGHKHLHLYTELNVCKRKYDFEQSCLKFLHKKEPKLDPQYDGVLLNIKYANRPLYWVSDYLNKELPPFYVGIEKEGIEKEHILLEKLDKANMRKRLFRHQFMTLYEYLVKESFTGLENTDYSSPSHYVLVCEHIEAMGFDVSPMLHQPKLYRRLILFYQRNNQKRGTTIYDLISSEFKREEFL